MGDGDHAWVMAKPEVHASRTWLGGVSLRAFPWSLPRGDNLQVPLDQLPAGLGKHIPKILI